MKHLIIALNLALLTGCASNVAKVNYIESRLDTLESRLYDARSVMRVIQTGTLYDPCLVTIEEDRYGILCSVSPPLTNPDQAHTCLRSQGIATKLVRDTEGGGDVFMVNDVNDWKAVHVVDAVNSIRFCMVYGEPRKTDGKLN